MATPKKIKSIIKEINRIDNKIIEIYLQPLKRVPRFKAGQFLHLALDPYDPSKEWPESRVFSIASSPEDRNEIIKIIVSKQGKYTNRIYNECEIGKEVWLKLPYGDFIIDIDQKSVLIAGGTGITPFLSFLKNTETRQIQNLISLYYGVERKEHLLEQHFLRKLSREINIKIFVDQNSDGDVNTGILNIEKIFSETGLDNNYYISGPKSMINNFSKFLRNKGVQQSRIVTDDWE